MNVSGVARAIVLASWLLVPAVAQAQNKPDTTLQQRRDQLAHDLEGLSDGDPLMRVAVMEDILKRGDASAAYVAMRAGFASDDAALRNLAMRAWVAHLKRLNLTVVLPPDLQKQVDAAMFDQKQAADLFKPDTWLGAWSRRGFTLALGFTGVDLSTNSGKIWSMPSYAELNAVDFTISGTEFYSTFDVDFPGALRATCHLRLSPTQSLVLDGVITCDFGRPSPQLKVSAPMF